ncbi:tetratricopeptide repeat protein [Mucilaginibacter sp. BJC16-A38]|uniref:tetratricopeptide repeat protein n=1 Tax=Mucilaginibacter phenanthrenivorans TaxID=1234842 RepID=UPI002156F7BC|nr:tetratricopeptide repeat protein [Mucilaginibacter phenanthrenivorans]MCR8559455.1 tetratricopeptide repeat protein [Mucilaginibacter phenanthrenivorans]
MKFILLIICCLFGLSASAQWYRVDLRLKKHPRYPLIEIPADNSMARLKFNTSIKTVKIRPIILDRTEYSFQAAENIVMRTAQHNMRFRVYNDASYNFSELARLYIQQNRYSEAKWYLLQSNIISRQQNDDKHTIANLIDLATIKSDLGDFPQAQQDLSEAHDLANMRGLKEELAAIDKKMVYIKLNKNNAPKTDVRYAEVPLTKAELKNQELKDKSQENLKN